MSEGAVAHPVQPARLQMEAAAARQIQPLRLLLGAVVACQIQHSRLLLGGVLPESVDRGVVAVPELNPTNASESRLLRQDDLLVVLIWQIEGSCSKLCSSRFLHRVVLATREINKGNPLALDGKRCMWYRPIELEPFVSDVMNFPSDL